MYTYQVIDPESDTIPSSLNNTGQIVGSTLGSPVGCIWHKGVSTTAMKALAGVFLSAFLLGCSGHDQGATPQSPEVIDGKAQVAPPTLQITAINPSQPIHNQSWSVHFRLTNSRACAERSACGCQPIGSGKFRHLYKRE